MTVQRLFGTKQNAIEKDVKDRVKKIIKALSPTSHIFMPVQTGFGSPDLDFIVSINGFALRIETKVDCKKPTPRQIKTTESLTAAGVPVLFIDQHNLTDVAIVTDYLLTGEQAKAMKYSREQREEYTG